MKLPRLSALISSAVISGRSIICSDWDGSFLLRLTEPERTVESTEAIACSPALSAAPANHLALWSDRSRSISA